jgi:hypothetical protein
VKLGLPTTSLGFLPGILFHPEDGGDTIPSISELHGGDLTEQVKFKNRFTCYA